MTRARFGRKQCHHQLTIVSEVMKKTDNFGGFFVRHLKRMSALAAILRKRKKFVLQGEFSPLRKGREEGRRGATCSNGGGREP